MYLYYSFTCLTAPIAGVIIGGVIFGSIGGYNSKKSLRICCILGSFAALSAVPIPFLSNKISVYLLLWFVFFFGASILPTMTGIMLNSVEMERRTTANSIATLAYNLFGYLPSPFVYGLFSDIIKGDEITSHRVALAVILGWSIPAVLFIVCAYFKRDPRKRRASKRLN